MIPKYAFRVEYQLARGQILQNGTSNHETLSLAMLDYFTILKRPNLKSARVVMVIEQNTRD